MELEPSSTEMLAPLAETQSSMSLQPSLVVLVVVRQTELQPTELTNMATLVELPDLQEVDITVEMVEMLVLVEMVQMEETEVQAPAELATLVFLQQ